jgi:hypothetical protein
VGDGRWRSRCDRFPRRRFIPSSQALHPLVARLEISKEADGSNRRQTTAVFETEADWADPHDAVFEALPLTNQPPKY